MTAIRSAIRSAISPAVSGALGLARPKFNQIINNYRLLSGTFTRNSTATVIDHEGVIRTVRANEIRSPGARRVENLLTASEDFTNSSWVKINGITAAPSTNGWTKVIMNGTNDPYLGEYVTTGALTNRDFVFSGEIYTDAGQPTEVTLFCNTAPVAETHYVKVTISTTPTRFSILADFDGTTATALFARFDGQNTPPPGSYFYVRNAQLEEVTGQTNQNPSEYVSSGVLSAPYHGANVDSVKYFDYENGNTVVNNVVTEAQGAAIPDSTLKGVLIEGQRINLSLDYDSGANETFSIVDTGDHTISMLGTGSVTVSAGTAAGTGLGVATGGSDITVNITTPGTIMLTVAGSVEYKQVEKGSFSTSMIPTNGATATRIAGTLTSVASIPTRNITIYMTVTPEADFADMTDAEIRLFGTNDSRGGAYQLRTIGAASYGFIGAEFSINKADFLKDVAYNFEFVLAQDGADIIAIIKVDGVEKLNTTVAGALDHSNQKTMTIGSSGADNCFASFKNVRVK